MAKDKKFDEAQANLAHSQALVDLLNTPAQQPAPPQQAPAPQPEPQPVPQPEPQAPEPQISLQDEAAQLKSTTDKIGEGFEAVSKLADAIKEVTGVKKDITKRLKETIRAKRQS